MKKKRTKKMMKKSKKMHLDCESEVVTLSFDVISRAVEVTSDRHTLKISYCLPMAVV